jgi:hypothetical protein
MATNSLITNKDTSKVFLGSNKYDSESYINNSGYDPITILEGTVMGRIHATGILVPCLKGANNGSQFPIGVLKGDLAVPAGSTVNGTICVWGEVDEDKLIFWDYQITKDTVISERRIKDWLQIANITLRTGTEMTATDNQ